MYVYFISWLLNLVFKYSKIMQQVNKIRLFTPSQTPLVKKKEKKKNENSQKNVKKGKNLTNHLLGKQDEY